MSIRKPGGDVTKRKNLIDEGWGFVRWRQSCSHVAHFSMKNINIVGTMVSFRLVALFAALTVASGERFNEIKVSDAFARGLDTAISSVGAE